MVCCYSMKFQNLNFQALRLQVWLTSPCEHHIPMRPWGVEIHGDYTFHLKQSYHRDIYFGQFLFIILLFQVFLPFVTMQEPSKSEGPFKKAQLERSNASPFVLPISLLVPCATKVLNAKLVRTYHATATSIHFGTQIGVVISHCVAWVREQPKSQKKVTSISILQEKSTWWLNQPIWKIFVKMGIFPKFRVKIQKYSSCHHQPENIVGSNIAKTSAAVCHKMDPLLAVHVITRPSWYACSQL